jgi:hypothetical protein
MSDELHVVGIKKCHRCGDTGDDRQYGLRGIARIGGNICVKCVREIEKSDTSTEADDLDDSR